MSPRDAGVENAPANWADGLDEKERLFVEGYLQTLNKRHAMEYAGYAATTARIHAWKVYNRPRVRQAIEYCLSNRTGVTRPWLVDQLAAIANTCLADIGEWDEEGNFKLKRSSELTDEQKQAVSEVIHERHRGVSQTKIKLHDKLAALAQIAKLLNLTVERQEISGPKGGPIETASSDVRMRIEGRLNDIAKRLTPDVG